MNSFWEILWGILLLAAAAGVGFGGFIWVSNDTEGTLRFASEREKTRLLRLVTVRTIVLIAVAGVLAVLSFRSLIM